MDVLIRKKTLNHQNDIDFQHTSMNRKYELILKTSRMFHCSNLNQIKAASSIEWALTAHAPWGMLPSGFLHATPCD